MERETHISMMENFNSGTEDFSPFFLPLICRGGLTDVGENCERR